MRILDIADRVEVYSLPADHDIAVDVADIGVIRIFVANIGIETLLIIGIFIEKEIWRIAGLDCFGFSQSFCVLDLRCDTIDGIALGFEIVRSIPCTQGHFIHSSQFVDLLPHFFDRRER